MRKPAPRLLAAVVIGLGVCGQATAGPHEDANAADARADYVVELAILRPNAEQGQAWAQNNLGNMYAGGHGVPKDYAQAVYWYRKAADQGDKGGEINLGEAYQQGDGVPADVAKAAELYLKAARQGVDEGLPALELVCLPVGLTAVAGPPDCSQVVPLLKVAAEKGDVRAQTSLAQFYETGMFPGLNKDPEQAIFWYRKAAELGDAGAQTSLAVSYEYGAEGTPKDDDQALVWWRKAADQGDFSAELELAHRYEDGQGVPKDSTRAFYWNRKLAEQGLAHAQQKVGAAYATGEGVVRDYVQAYEWLEIARLTELGLGRGGGDVAAIAQDGVAAHLTPAQLDQARKFAAAWKPDRSTPAAPRH